MTPTLHATPLRAGDTVLVAGPSGPLGPALGRRLATSGVAVAGLSPAAVDLRDRAATLDALRAIAPSVLVVAAGGPDAGAAWEPVALLHDTLRIQANLLDAAHAADVDRLVLIAADRDRTDRTPAGSWPTDAGDALALVTLAGVLGVRAHRHQYGRSWVTVVPSGTPGTRSGAGADAVAGLVAEAVGLGGPTADPGVPVARPGGPVPARPGSGRPRHARLRVVEETA